MENALLKLRAAAEVANGNAQQILGDYQRKPVFDSNSQHPGIAQAQKRASARDRLLCTHERIRDIVSAVRDGKDAEALSAQVFIQRAVVSVLKTPPIFVGNQSYPTAHEAALAVGDAVLHAWQEAGGYYAIERAPDRLQAEHDGHDADVAIEVSTDLRQRLRRLRKNLPPDLWE